MLRELVKEKRDFLDRLERKFLQLLRECPYPQQDAQLAADRLEAAELLASRPGPQDPPSLAALKLVGDNPKLENVWVEVREAGHWKYALTPEEFVTALLPRSATLD